MHLGHAARRVRLHPGRGRRAVRHVPELRGDRLGGVLGAHVLQGVQGARRVLRRARQALVGPRGPRLLVQRRAQGRGAGVGLHRHAPQQHGARPADRDRHARADRVHGRPAAAQLVQGGHHRRGVGRVRRVRARGRGRRLGREGRQQVLAHPQFVGRLLGRARLRARRARQRELHGVRFDRHSGHVLVGRAEQVGADLRHFRPEF